MKDCFYITSEGKWIVAFVVICLLNILPAIAQKTELVIQTGHQSDVDYVNISPDETMMFSVDSKNTGILWNLQTGKQLRIFRNAKVGAFRDDGKSLLIFYNDKNAAIVDFNGNVINTYSGRRYSSDWVSVLRPELYTGPGFLLVEQTLFKIYSRESVKINMYDDPTASSYSPKTGMIAVAARKEENLMLADTSGKFSKSIPLKMNSGIDVNYLNFSRDGQLLLAAGGQGTGTISVFNVQSNQVVKSFQVRDLKYARIMPDGKRIIVITYDEIKMIDLSSETQVWNEENTGNFTMANISSQGNRIILSGKNDFEIKDALSGATLRRVNSTNVADLQGIQLYSSDKNLAVFANRTASLWSFQSGRVEKKWTSSGINPMKINPAGNRIIGSMSQSSNSQILVECDIENASNNFTYPTANGSELISKSNISFDGKYISKVGQVSTGSSDIKKVEVFQSQSKNLITSMNSTELSGVFANTKNWLVIKENDKSTKLSFYNLPEANMIHEITDPEIAGLSTILFSTTDKYVAMPNNNGAIVFDLSTKRKINLSSVSASGNYSMSYAFSPDDKYFLSGNKNGLVQFYNLTSGTVENTLNIPAHSSGVENIRFSKDARFMYTSGEDNTIKIWDYKTRKLVATLYTFPDTDDWAVITPEGYFDGTPNAQKKLHYVKGINTIDLADMYEKFYTPQLLVRILNGEKLKQPDVTPDGLKPKPTVSIAYKEGNSNERRLTYANTSGTAEITVSATAPDDKVDEIRLFHNGKAVNLATRGLFVTDADGTDTKKYTINLLPGQNNFRAIALNSQRTESEPDEIIVAYNKGGGNAPAPVKPADDNKAVVDEIDKNATLHIVVVGINAYKGKINPLTYALPDATAFKAELEKDAKSFVNNVKSYLIADDNATKAGIVAAFENIKKSAKPEDVFVFYYAGHGYIHPSNKEFYLVSSDVADGNESLLKNGVSAKELQTFAVDIPAQKQLFIMDACQSAGAFEQMLKHDGEQQKALAVVSRSTGTHWMAASGSTETAKEFGELGHGVFTYSLLEALKGKAVNNKMITVNGLKNYLQVIVPELVKKYGGNSQYPASYGFGNDFPVEIVK